MVSGKRSEENWPPALKHENHQCLVLTVPIGSEQDSSKEMGAQNFHKQVTFDRDITGI